MPKFLRTKHASYLPEDELDDLHLIEEEEEEEESEEDEDSDEGADETSLNLDDPEEDGDDEEDPEDDEDEEDPEDDEDEEEVKPAKKARAEARIRQLAKQRKEAKAEAAAAKEQLRQFQMSQQQMSQQREPSAAEEAAYRASLDPEQLIRYDVGKVLGRQKQQNELLAFNMQDTIDKQGYDAQATARPIMQKFSAQVEKKLKELRMQGMNVPRMAILQNIIGERVLAGNSSKTVSRAKAKENMKKNKVKSSSGRSDTKRENTRGGNSDREARNKRLANVTF